jgi:tRNA G18 (ribose-2'-O)-methylase SpoU
MRNQHRRPQSTEASSGRTKSRQHQLIYGVNAVEEALRAGRRQFESITILESARPDRLKRLLILAREHGVPIHRVPRLNLDRELIDARHQGVVARIAAAHYADPGRFDQFISGKDRNRRSAVGRWVGRN